MAVALLASPPSVLPRFRFRSKKFHSPKCSSSSVVQIPKQSVSVILLAGGVGKRMEANMPKQYLPLMGKPIALHRYVYLFSIHMLGLLLPASFHTFASMSQMAEIIVVCDPSYRDLFQEAGEKISPGLKFASPGKERQDSVFSGLTQVDDHARLVCIHDSARPLVLVEDIHRVMQDAWTHGAAVLGVPVKATIKEAGGDMFVKKTLDRRTLWEMQTPQVIEPSLLRRGFDYVLREGLEVTDDVSIVEYLQQPVFITQGSYTNIKVTTPDDMLVAERILEGRA